MVGALASWFTLRGHLSLLDATVGMVSHFVPLVEWRAHWAKRDAFESTSDSQYPHSTAYRLKMGTSMSRSLPQTHLWLHSQELEKFENLDWPQHKLEDQENWSLNGTLNYTSILQLDLFCWKQGKRTHSEVPYVQIFMTLNQNLVLRHTCHMSFCCRLIPMPTPHPHPSLSPSPSDLLDDPNSAFPVHIWSLSLQTRKGFWSSLWSRTFS